jgi:glycerol kinase
MQCVSNTLNHPLTQCDAPEASAVGAAYLAGLSLGVWSDIEDIAALPRHGNELLPVAGDTAARLAIWRDAIQRSTLETSSFKGE